MTRLRAFWLRHMDNVVIAVVLVAIVVGLSVSQEHDAAMLARAAHQEHNHDSR